MVAVLALHAAPAVPAVQPPAQDVGAADALVRFAVAAAGCPASALMACAAWKSSAEISGSWAMVSDQIQLPASFQRIRVS